MNVSCKSSFSEPEYKFPSDGTMNPLGESAKNFNATNAGSYEDVFGKSVLDFDVWLSPTQKEKKVVTRKVPKSSSGTRPRSRSQPKSREPQSTREEPKSSSGTLPRSRSQLKSREPQSTREERKLAESSSSKEKKKKSRRDKSVDTLNVNRAAVPSIDVICKSPKKDRRRSATTTTTSTDNKNNNKDMPSEIKTSFKTPKVSSHRRLSAISVDESNHSKTPCKPPKASSRRRKPATDDSSKRCKSPKVSSHRRKSTLDPPGSAKPTRSSRTPSRRRRSHAVDEDNNNSSRRNIGMMDLSLNIEPAPTLDPKSLKTATTTTATPKSAPKRQQSSESIITEGSFAAGDRIGELMDFLRKENGAEKSDLMSSQATTRKIIIPSDPNRLRKKLLEENSSPKKSYLPKKFSGRVYGSDFRKVRRRESVKDSLQHFLKDTADDSLLQTAERTVVSAPVSASTKKVRSSRSINKSKKKRVTASQTLESHLHSTRVLKNQDNEYRSVVSAPALAGGLGQKCQQYRVEF
jgi:hypothetical protein